MYMLKSTDKKERLSYDLLERTRMYILCICHTGYLPHKIYTKKEKRKWKMMYIFRIYHTRYLPHKIYTNSTDEKRAFV